VRRACANHPINVHVSPLPAHQSGINLAAAAVAFLDAAPAGQQEMDFGLARADALTPSEQMLALALADGLSVKEYAATHRRSENTVRSQLKSAMSKLGVRRQVELVRLVIAARARLRVSLPGVDTVSRTTASM
jgi:DNA-binding NarL/FixJ family response regulator